MAYLTSEELRKLPFRKLGKGVKISDKAAIYDYENIEIGDYSRIDDFCIVSGSVKIGNFCHITPTCLLAGGVPGITLSNFCTLAYGVKIFSQSDDYSGGSMVNSLIPKKYKKELFAPVVLESQVIIGASSVVMPGVLIGEGCSVGAMSLVNKSCEAWGIYYGAPVKRSRDRSKNVLRLQDEFLREFYNDSI